jgi:hypothetical protein
MDPGEILWISPAQCRLKEAPNGFPLRVLRLQGWWSVEEEVVRVSGMVLSQDGDPIREVVIPVPLTQPRARIMPPTDGSVAVIPTGVLLRLALNEHTDDVVTGACPQCHEHLCATYRRAWRALQAQELREEALAQ